jgi:pyruvate/2-oxoglutarate dehydrogenase complex dihydrolipoamide dehydrogenase (E3) component
LPRWTHAVVVGGGITAAQTALALVHQYQSAVTLLMRHPVRVHHFDADPCWVGLDCLKAFHAERDYTRRREMISRARHRGSLPMDVARLLQAAVTAGLLTRQLGAVTQAGSDEEGWIDLQLDPDAGTISADCLILATGFDSTRPGGDWLDRAIQDYDLPVANCGYPIVDHSLRWHPGLYVSGPLAELEVGPVSRNIIGAKLTGERIASTVG